MARIFPRSDFDRIKLLERKVEKQQDTIRLLNQQIHEPDQHLLSYDFLIRDLTKKLEREHEKNQDLR